ncbi:MAG: PilZ domain-containing protein [Candidatus Omnitrophica bacterium]|nr:PilZ domain-containing protein [Candidatus Omnitrophota bacterium]
MENPQEKRQYVRVKSKLSVDWHPYEDDSIKVSMDTDDLSQGGTKIITSRKPIVGSKITVSLRISKKDELEMPGEIVRVIPNKDKPSLNDVGIKFTKLTAEQERLLKAYIAAQTVQRAP